MTANVSLDDIVFYDSIDLESAAERLEDELGIENGIYSLDEYLEELDGTPADYLGVFPGENKDTVVARKNGTIRFLLEDRAATSRNGSEPDKLSKWEPVKANLK